MSSRQMHLGVFAVGTGNHIAGWRHPGAFKDASKLRAFVTMAQTAERGKLDMFDQLASYIDERSAMETFSLRMGHDMSQYPLDGPVPELPQHSEGSQGYTRMILTEAYRESATLRDLYNLFAVSRGYLIVYGSPSRVVDTMQEWFEAPACDGFNLTPAHFPESLDDFVELVVPELQRCGLFRTEYSGRTLRDHFGLPVPENRYTDASE